MVIVLPKWFRIAEKESLKSNYKYKIGAVVVKGGSIISIGHNDIRYRSTGCSKYSDWKESLHAERACISKVSKELVNGSSIYIFRRDNEQGLPALSKPCPQCAKLISDMGIKKVYFTTSQPPYYELIKL